MTGWGIFLKNMSRPILESVHISAVEFEGLSLGKGKACNYVSIAPTLQAWIVKCIHDMVLGQKDNLYWLECLVLDQYQFVI
jgi:hypothetical protein